MASEQSPSDAQETTESIERLTQHVELLCEAVDELRDGLVYELRNLRDSLAAMSPGEPAARLGTVANVVRQTRPSAQAAAPAETFEEFVARLQQLAPDLKRTSAESHPGATFVPGIVVEVDAEILGWVMQATTTIWDRTSWCVAEGPGPAYFVLWRDGSRSFVRKLTDAESKRFGMESVRDCDTAAAWSAPAPSIDAPSS